MNSQSTHIIFFIFIVLFLKTFTISANVNHSDAKIEEGLEKAKEYLNSFKNDSATVILTQLVEDLSQNNQIDSPIGLQVQIQQAIALEQDHQDEKAIEKLLHVVEKSPKHQQWDALAHAYLSLARLHEKLGRKEDCIKNLRSAQYTIKQHNLEEIYPRFSIRISSYHRIFGIADSAIYYAKEILRTAPKFNKGQEEAVGHLLMGLLIGKEDYKKAIGHYKKAGKSWEKVGDHSGHAAIKGNISNLYLKNNQPELALLYNDSALMVAQKAADGGNDQLYLFYNNYQDKGAIYKTLGQTDSAIYYLEKGYKLELDDVYQSNNEKVIEVEAKYQDEKKVQKINQQEQEIKQERERRYLLSGFTFVILLLFSLLTYYYLRLRKANKKTEAQSIIINTANKELSDSLEQQILLQAEVHHRVKNNLQVIISLLELHMEEMDEPKSIQSFEDMINRIYSMASIHEILYQQEDAVNVNFKEYVKNLCNHFSNFLPLEEKPIIEIDIQNQYFNLETSMPLGIILTELLTNSFKYGHIPVNILRIYIKLQKEEEEYSLVYKDNGPGFIENQLVEREGGLGTYLLTNISRQLKGRVESRNDNGALSIVYFKIKNKRTTHPQNNDNINKNNNNEQKNQSAYSRG